MMADENQNSATESAVETQVTSAPEAAEEDFSQLLAESNHTEQKTFTQGMIVEGIIVQISAEYAYVNIGAKAEASIAVSELLNPEDNKLTHAVGDTIKAKIVGFENGAAKLSRTLKAGNFALEEAYQSGCAVKALVKATNKGGFELEVMGQRAFCPLSQIQKGKVEDPNALIGQSFDFKIIKYAKRGHDIVLSRTALLDDELRLKREEAMAKIEVGNVLDGKVVSLQQYGAFVDVGGVEGLVHVSEISHKHVGHPKEVLSVGQDVKVYVLAIADKDGKSKLSLSMKKLEADPFDTLCESILPGSKITGTVVRNVDKIGSFVDLGGVEGLVHISELTWDRHITNPDDVVKVGDKIEVTVLGINAEKHRVSLSYKGQQVDPWANAEENYPIGKEVTGKIDSVTNFGIFVKLAPRLTALLPMSELSEATRGWTEAAPGTEITAKVIAVDTAKKRLTLSTRDESQAAPARKPRVKREETNKDNDAPRERAPRNKRDRDDSSSYKDEARFGSLGDVLAGLKKKK
ncbi:MAG: S1 RNA-binding domain-containing protein [Proteobacteria bacterium]|nr:S1 RNA-binding domain-containing protein [Pseudomonadota bacterium]